eukprot:CAMPEP_0119370556 /NCGR_PEP_ID=MMETSP1334-20130426/16919_1 /TAXON_ID=127549 /ORGANISM="Calcidiscus leptoporus, Strain RCC1130" /LENGTH=48 /DNA_ID= /DNA_START= /DNA_END= /DNA_ORIENTATION=
MSFDRAAKVVSEGWFVIEGKFVNEVRFVNKGEVKLWYGRQEGEFVNEG